MQNFPALTTALFLLITAGVPSQIPTPTPDLDGDNDGVVGPRDLVLLAEQWRNRISIEFTNVPPIGSLSSLSGIVTGVLPSDHKVALYLKVGDGWWTKPTADTPTRPINQDGAWTAEIPIAGADEFATEILAILLPVDVSPPPCVPCYSRPHPSESIAEAHVSREKTLSFAGREWTVKRRDIPSGPGPNLFSDELEDVFVDSQGLHLSIAHRGGNWYSTEVVLNEALGYGTYIFQTSGRLDTYDPNVVGGIFTYETDSEISGNRELDIEFAKWGGADNPTNAQFVIQPCNACPGCGDEQCERFQFDLTDEDNDLTHFIQWAEGGAIFQTFRGTHLNSTPQLTDLIHEKRWTHSGVPTRGDERVRINLWLFGGAPPTDGLQEDLILTGFEFRE